VLLISCPNLEKIVIGRLLFEEYELKEVFENRYLETIKAIDPDAIEFYGRD
jgi:hypothetical protein